MPIAPRTHRPPQSTARRVRGSDTNRGTAVERGYDHRWNKVRLLIRQRDCYLCQECKRQGRLTPANEVDHIIPLRVAPEKRLEESNLEVKCHSCHVRKTHEDAKRYGPVR